MYNAQSTRKRIMEQCKNQSAEQMLKDLSLGVNAIRQINDAKGIASFSLAKIADYLDCSVDYLLGRTENPQSHKGGVSFGDLSNNSGIVGNVGSTITATPPMDEQTAEMLEVFKKLSPLNKAKLRVYANDLIKSNTEQPQINTTATYRINTYKMSDKECEKIKKYLQSYSCTLVKNVKSYMEFIADSDFDIEGMLVAGGFWVSVKKLTD